MPMYLVDFYHDAHRSCLVRLALRGDPLGGRGAMRGKHSRARRGRRSPKSPRPPQMGGSRPPVCGRARAAPRSSRQIRCTGRGRCRIFCWEGPSAAP